MSTVFDRIITKENDHTNLLRNLMDRHPMLAGSILSCLLERSVADSEAATFNYQTQHSFLSANGREIPDILVTGNRIHCIIEAKIDPRLGLTDRQQIGYRCCFPASGERYLAFLVPEDWTHEASIQSVCDALQGSGISVSLCRWGTLIAAAEGAAKVIQDEVLNEALHFWKWRFELTRMTSDERLTLQSWTPSTYCAIRKLEKTIDQARKLFEARGFTTEPETSEIEVYGFYIKRERFYLLWVGIWTKAQTPLSFAYHLTKSNWLKPRNAPKGPATVENHHLWGLESESWDNPEKIYTTVRSFIDHSWPTE